MSKYLDYFWTFIAMGLSGSGTPPMHMSPGKKK